MYRICRSDDLMSECRIKKFILCNKHPRTWSYSQFDCKRSNPILDVELGVA